MAEKQIRDAVILAAGKGERLWPYGDTTPKAALSVGNAPLIHYQLDALASSGVKLVTVVTGHLEGVVRNACHSWSASSNSGTVISFVSMPASKGTAQSACAGLLARPDPDAPCYLLPGDLYFSVRDLQAVAAAFSGENVSALVSSVGQRSVQEGFRADVSDGRILRVLAHPRGCEEGSRMFTSLLAVPAGFHRTVRATPELATCVEIGAMPPCDPELVESVHQFLLSGGNVVAVEALEEVVDINKPWDLLDANMLSARRQTDLLTENVLAEGSSIDPIARIEGKVRLGENSRIGPGVVVYGNLVVGKNTQVTDGAFIENQVVIGDDCKVWRGCLIGGQTVVGNRCHIGHGAEFQGVMMDESYSYHYGEYWGILGRCADLGAATVCGTLRFDDGETVHRVRGRKEVPRCHSNATYLGDYVRTGVNAILMPGVKVGAYSLIGAGVLLSGDVPNNTSVYVEQSLKRGPWGPERYGW
jgi:bifunctional UDP-N-acetylglucosamine pyrophosphorylase/glucosamine-1-phosphate N-acetyltransferase